MQSMAISYRKTPTNINLTHLQNTSLTAKDLSDVIFQPPIFNQAEVSKEQSSCIIWKYTIFLQ